MTEAIDDNQRGIIKKAVQDFVDAQLQDKEPDIEEFVKRYPGLEHQIKQSIRDMQRINTMFDSLVQADESDFEDAAAGEKFVGKTIGNFEITEMIGSGGMGIVYLARDTRLDRLVAIKSIPVKQKESLTARMRLKREARLLASLNHPNIAVIYDIIEQDDGDDFLVLEYVHGKTLAELIAGKPLKLKQALSIARQVAEAVSVAHKAGIIHRDLKPANIKITPDGSIKVLDFGLAKVPLEAGRSGEVTSTEPGRVIGTPAYMSPEQARGKDTDHRTDIWSFGCIMYQMLTAHLPFEGQTATDTLARIIERQPDWELLPKEIPANIRALLQRCLEKDPNRRLGDVGDAAIEISESLNKSVTAPVAIKPLKPRRVAMITGVVTIIILSGVALKFIPRKEIPPSSKEIRLVVLPFQNLGPAEQEWFADGMTDEITTRLAGIHGLGVISRQSAIQYKNKEIGTQQIAEELNVDYILEGTVQCERPSDPNSQVRIRTQLIKAADDTHVWARPYDNDMRNIFRLQSDVAEQVAQALDITLLEPERRTLASETTENTEAYNYYLRGNEYFNRLSEDDLKRAIHMFEQAIALDPNSAKFHAALANVLIYRYFRYGQNQEYLTRAKKEVDTALKLDPDLFLARIVLGRYYYQGLFDYDRAYEQFDWARQSHPNNAAGWRWMGVAQTRQGRFKEALPNLKRASELNPLDLHLIRLVPVALKFLGKYAEAETYLDKVIRLEPDKPGAYIEKSWMCILQGNTKKARAVMEKALLNVSKDKDSRIYDWLVVLDIYDGEYAAALEKLSSKSHDVDILVMFIPNALRKAEIYGYMDKEKLEKQCYESAVDILERKVAENPNVSRYRSALGIAYAGLGLEQRAIEEGSLGVKYETKDAVDKPQRIEDLARIYVMVGKYDEAIEKLEYLLSIPSEMSGHSLRLDPVWDSLRDHPRFMKLIDSGK